MRTYVSRTHGQTSIGIARQTGRKKKLYYLTAARKPKKGGWKIPKGKRLRSRIAAAIRRDRQWGAGRSPGVRKPHPYGRVS